MDNKYCENNCKYLIKKNHKTGRQTATCFKYSLSNNSVSIRTEGQSFVKCYACRKSDDCLGTNDINDLSNAYEEINFQSFVEKNKHVPFAKIKELYKEEHHQSM